MRKYESILSNLEAIENWHKINAMLSREGINPLTAREHLKVFNMYIKIRQDGYKCNEAYRMLSEKYFKQYKVKTIKNIVLSMNKVI